MICELENMMVCEIPEGHMIVPDSYGVGLGVIIFMMAVFLLIMLLYILNDHWRMKR